MPANPRTKRAPIILICTYIPRTAGGFEDSAPISLVRPCRRAHGLGPWSGPGLLTNEKVVAITAGRTAVRFADLHSPSLARHATPRYGQKPLHRPTCRWCVTGAGSGLGWAGLAGAGQGRYLPMKKTWYSSLMPYLPARPGPAALLSKT